MMEYVAIECIDCGVISEDVPKGEPCPECNSHSYTEVIVEPCPLPESEQDSCTDETHHWGRDDHVVDAG